MDSCLWLIARPTNKQFNPHCSLSSLSFGVTTFMNRYEDCFKPLIRKLALIFPECQIIVIANGHVKQSKQQIYLKRITEFCNSFNNIELITYLEPRGLSHLWNQIVQCSKNQKILILNDDIKISMNFRRFITEYGITGKNIATINSSWSHFLISKEIIKKIGLFDEQLLEIGGEDDDYAARLAIANQPTSNFETKTIGSKLRNKRKQLSLNSYGKDMTKELNGYSTNNSNYLSEKWEWSDKYFDGAVEVQNRGIRYWKLRSQELKLFVNKRL